MKTVAINETESDARLVERCLGGDHDAFARIVERYQSLVCSLTFGTCGHLQTSEDLAQTTFITAWNDLSKLKEPSRLKSWLCGIARNITNNSIRKMQRTPSENSQGMDKVGEIPSPEPPPNELAITRDEEALLEKAMGALPVSYREPLVLYYRQHQSAAEVAEVLGLSEGTVHQRLSRGRAMLTKNMVKRVETALCNSAPGDTFTLGVLAVLPMAGASAKIATAGLTVRTAASCGALKTLVGIAPLASIGAFLGYKMSVDAEHSPRLRESVIIFWRIIVGCFVVFIALPFLLAIILATTSVQIPKETLLFWLSTWMGALYPVVTIAMIVWAVKRRRKYPLPKDMSRPKKKRLAMWVLSAVIGSIGLLVLIFSDSLWNAPRLSTDEVHQLIADAPNQRTEFKVFEYPNEKRFLLIKQYSDGENINYISAADDSLLARLTEQGITYRTLVQGRDFEVFGWPGKFLAVFCILIIAMGSIILIRHRPKRR